MQAKPVQTDGKNSSKLEAESALRDAARSSFRGPIENHHGTIRVRVEVQREGSEYWARAVPDPVRPDLMPLASGPTRELAIYAACEKASIPTNTQRARSEMSLYASE